MSDLKIESNIDNSIIIKGDTSRIKNNKLAMMYLRNNLKFSIVDADIVINSECSINETMNHIKVLANYAHCGIVYNTNVSKAIKDYEREEQEFDVFSQQAKAIRNNESNISIGFNEFKESLIAHLPNRSLYPLQLLSAYHLAFSQNACNFSVPGAGKTSVVYGAYAYLKSLPMSNNKHVDKLLIIGPLSSFGPWENEYEECFGVKPSSLRLTSACTPRQKSNYLRSMMTEEITITSYQSVASMVDDLELFLRNNQVMVVLDEAHKIKNAKGAITATSTLRLAQHAKARVVLTGTPAPNGYEDLFNLFKFIWPNREIVKFSLSQLENMSKSIEDERVPSLIEQITPYFIRVKKSDLNIPPAITKVVNVPMTESHRTIYDIIENRIIPTLNSSTDIQFIKKIRKAKLVRLMQAVTNPELLKIPMGEFLDEEGHALSESEEDITFINEIKDFIKNEIPQKFVVAADIAENIIKEGGKVVIWASFIRNIEQLSDYLKSRGISSKILDGATPVEGNDKEEVVRSDTREGIVKEFNRDNSSFNVIIANPFAVAESISLHKKCHNAIYLERSFNAAHFIQSKDRIHRYGLPSDTVTTYYYLLSENSIDQTIDDRLTIKENRLNEIMESTPIPLFDNLLEDGGLNDIKAIINDYLNRTKKI